MTIEDLKKSRFVKSTTEYFMLSETVSHDVFSNDDYIKFYDKQGKLRYRTFFPVTLKVCRNDTCFYYKDREFDRKHGKINPDELPTSVNFVELPPMSGHQSEYSKVLTNYHFKSDSLIEMYIKKSNSIFAAMDQFPVDTLKFKEVDTIILNRSELFFSWDQHCLYTKSIPYKGMVMNDHIVFKNIELQTRFFEDLFNTIVF